MNSDRATRIGMKNIKRAKQRQERERECERLQMTNKDRKRKNCLKINQFLLLIKTHDKTFKPTTRT